MTVNPWTMPSKPYCETLGVDGMHFNKLYIQKYENCISIAIMGKAVCATIALDIKRIKELRDFLNTIDCGQTLAEDGS